jgi:hypothetical protein
VVPAIEPATGHGVADVCDAVRIGRTLLATVGVDDDDLARLEADLDERVEVWTPWVRLQSRFDLMSMLVDSDDTIANIEVEFTKTIATSSAVLLEWCATARFTGTAVLFDDELIEPTGAKVLVAEVLSLSCTDGHRPNRISCYLDRLSIIEQLVRSSRAAGAPRSIGEGHEPVRPVPADDDSTSSDRVQSGTDCDPRELANRSSNWTPIILFGRCRGGVASASWPVPQTSGSPIVGTRPGPLRTERG